MMTTDDHRRALMLDLGKFLAANRDQLDADTQASADDLAQRALTLSFPDDGVDLRWPASESTPTGYRDHSVTLAQVEAVLRGETPGADPYPDGANLSHVVQQATDIMDGLTGLVDAAGAPKVGTRVH